ncbi:receptor protein kinase WSS1-like [Typha angustifolia]|uniref:receptor protein kinase WSS1-like n=1 Tax=Typha angustifolia TaxID=59011 RepID=UPI003C2F8EB5
MGRMGNGSSSSFLLLRLLYMMFVVAAFVSARSGDSQAMWDLAKSLSNLPKSWVSGTDPCNPAWDGVTCDSSGAVTDINLGKTSVSGSLPVSLSTLASLQSLQLQSNQISGPLPSLSKLATLQRLLLDGNAFSSIPADFFSGLSGLQYVSLDDNPFDPWSVPKDVASIDGLTVFSASNASIGGLVPDFFGSLPNLQILRLSYNNFTGGLPSSLAGSTIRSLYLNNQVSPEKLTGPIDVIGAMADLKLVWLQSNGFTGPIPDLSNLTSLESFKVRDNSLTGVVPPSLTSMSTLKNVTLSNNELQGPFPSFTATGVLADVDSGNNFCKPTPGPCDARVATLLEIAAGFGYPTELATSWKGNDPCGAGGGGWLGVSCDTAGAITVLNFPNKNFSGTISPEIANLTSLTKVILSNNRLHGSVPDSLATLPQLQLLDVTNNSLSGKVPSFNSSVVVKLSGNSFGNSNSGGGSGDEGASGTPTDGSSGSSAAEDQSSGSKSSGTTVVIGTVVAVAVLVACLVALFLHYRKKKNVKKFGPVPTGTPPGEQEVVKIGVVGMNGNGSNGGLSQLYSQSSAESAGTHMFEMQGMHMSIQSLRNATNNFSESNILGKGGFGVVYKGEHNGTTIAVKRNECDLMGKKGQEEFRAEIDVLKKVRHRHLVALLGYCENGAERLLVYEYMPGGTLGQHLFDLHESGYSPLTWKQRLTIALDVARGIEYLHSMAQETFIHRDLKPSNILLDKDMRAKVSDFGLVKLATDNGKSMMTRLAGTFGYLAPEYAITGKVTTKVDVYAFGVILMELISGRKVLDDTLPDDESHLVACFRRNILDKERFIKSVDSTLDLDDEARNSLMDVADLARHCTAREPFQRPDMSHCVNKLSTLMDQWKPMNCEDEDNEAESSLGLNGRLAHWKFTDSSSTGLFSTYNGDTRRD